MMRVLLVNPYIYDFTAYDLWLRPLGLLYIAAVIKKYTDVEIEWLDALDRFSGDSSPKSKPDGRGKYHRELVEKPPIYDDVPRYYARYGIPLEEFDQKLAALPEVDVILVTSLMTYWVDGVNFTIDRLRKRFPKAHIVLGGVMPTLAPEKLKQQVPADHYIAGYGERAVLELLAAKGATVSPIPDFSNIDNIPLPAVEYLTEKSYLPLLTSRGCPYRCTYCASQLMNPTFAQRSAQQIADEVIARHREYGTRHFIVFDDALLINKHKRFFQAFQTVRDQVDVQFHTPNGTHTREIDEETAELLYQAGFRTLILSFESTSTHILHRSSDKVSVNHMETAVKNLTQAGFKPSELECYLLFGIPGQTIKEVEQSLEFVRQLGILPHLSYYSPVPGTPDTRDLQSRGILSSPIDLYETNKIYWLYQKSVFTHHQIHQIKQQAAQIARTTRPPLP
jgi:radical SAM superfamily enzyme YgiQ (UPF0313 family)